MVTCNLFGEYGNQLCQVSATIAYAHRWKMAYAIPPKTMNRAIWPYTYFANRPKFNSSGINQAYHKPIRTQYNEQANQQYDEIPRYDNVCLNGHFHSYKYFDPYRYEIFQALEFTYNPIDAVSIHVRRGDFLNFPNRHPVVTVEYLQKAVRYFLERGQTKFLVFSDDTPWCKENITGPGFEPASFSFIEGQDKFADFAMMRNCYHNIISRSSFSLMAAYFNLNENKMVVAPEPWCFLSKEEWDTSSIVPESWIKL